MEISGDFDNLRIGPPLEPWQPWECMKCGSTVFQVVYCKGGLPPTATVHFADDTKTATLDVQCSGINDEHLHLHCRVCGFHRLMETKDASERKARERVEQRAREIGLRIANADDLPRYPYPEVQPRSK